MVLKLVTAPFTNDWNKSPTRILVDASFRWISSTLSVSQMQSVMGTTLSVFQTWAQKNKMDTTVEELGSDARLLWLGGPNKEKVIIYLHGSCIFIVVCPLSPCLGGVYCLPVQDFALTFWKHSIEALRQRSHDFGFAALNYCKYALTARACLTDAFAALMPTAHFPTQLSQLVLAVEHLIAKGIKPQNITLVGESAGGALILQLVSHILHPYPGVPILPKSIRFNGACIMCPWVALEGNTGSFAENDKSDSLPAATWAYLGEQTLSKMTPDQCPYLEASMAPEGWFEGANSIFPEVLFTVGEKECLRDDVVKVAKMVEGAEVYIHPFGVHNDQYLDCMVSPKRKPGGGLTKRILDWLAERP